ncbi:unnamed protein product [Ophioblennius macclurei]
MEEDIRKQGVLYLQQQRFGKKWKRVWCVLYRESSCSISRLEFFECKDGGNVEKNDKSLRRQQEHKKVIRLADCIRVTEVDVEGRTRDTGGFLLETTDKIYVFAVERQQLEEWTRTVCEIAFPMSWVDVGEKSQRGEEDQRVEVNSLYGRRDAAACVFRVCVRRTEASDRCRLKGEVMLRPDVDHLQLLNQKGDVLYSWKYSHLRRFGRDKSSFSFEAGRRCQSGEGSFEFDTCQGNLLFQAVDTAINQQRLNYKPTPRAGPESPERPPGPDLDLKAQDGSIYSVVPKLSSFQHKDKEHHRPLLACLDSSLSGVKSRTLDPCSLLGPRKNQVKMISSCPLPHSDSDPRLGPSSGTRLYPTLSSDGVTDQTYSQITLSEKRSNHMPPPLPKEYEYSLPFDTVAQNSWQGAGSEPGSDPLYDSIDEASIRNVCGPTYAKAEHIYDEPEGCAAAASVYDDPEEMRGDAWRIMGTASDPKGHQNPYNPQRDDYAVPRRLQRSWRDQEEQDHKGQGEEVEEEEEQGQEEREKE